MQTIEKALHQPMPFTTGGQTITDRLNAAKHSLAGSQLGKTICKATTEELMAPKKKHLDYLLHCTNEPNVSIPQMANLLIERTQNPNWTVVYKSLITIHNIMCYGNERFSQYLASCNTTFNLGTFLDRTTSGYDMSTHVRRYGKYIGEKIATYRTCAFDFCKVKRGREDGLLRTMHTDKLLKTLPTLQNQIDALLEFSVSAGELNNGVINCSFILLFRDLIRLFACYNDGVINLLEKYFDMNKKQARDALDMYKTFLTRLDKVSDFLRVAESVGIERAEIPDLTRAPASLLEALEAHLAHLEGRPAVAASNPFAGGGGGMGGGHAAPNFFGGQTAYQPASATAAIGEAERNKSLELERAHLRQFEEARRAAGGGASTNPFSAPAAAPAAGPQPDLIDIFSAPQTMQQQQAAMPFDATNPFASFGAPAPGPAHSMMYGGAPVSNAPSYAMAASSNGFGADFTRAFSAPAPPPTSSIASTPSTFSNGNGRRPSNYAAGDAAKFGGDVDSALSNLATNLDISGHATQGKPVQWPNAPPARPPMGAPVGGYNPYVPTGMPPGGPMMQPMGGWGGPQQHPQMMGMYGGPPAGYGMPPQAGGPMGYGGMGMGQQQQQQPFQ